MLAATEVSFSLSYIGFFAGMEPAGKQSLTNKVDGQFGGMD